MIRPAASVARTMIPQREREAVAAERELAGHEAVLGEDREQPRERVEARVRGEDEEHGRERLEQEERRSCRRRRRAAATWLMTVCRSGSSTGAIPKFDREERDPDEQHAEEAGHDGQRRRRVLRLRRLERRHAGRDRLGAGQRDGAGRERPQDEDHRDGLDRVAALLDDRRCTRWPSPRTTIRNVPIAIISSAPNEEQVRREGEDVARLAEPAEVADRDQGDRSRRRSGRVRRRGRGTPT